MGEDSFFNALFHIMWNMETDIFSEKEKTLALLADLVAKCKKQRKRIEAMYACGAMDLIENAVANRDEYEMNLKKAVRVMIDEMNLSSEKALFAVNQIIGLWGGDLEELEEYDEDENQGEEDDEEDGEDDMIFLQDTTTEEPELTEDEENEDEEENGNQEEETKESLLKRLVCFWCESDFEEGRPCMFACPVGWVIILLCSALGAFMIYDIPVGDKFIAPTFVFMFAILTSKRLYRFESTGRFSLLIVLFYLVAVGRSLWLGKGDLSLACIPIVIASFIVFNSGRIGSWLDESKKKAPEAYLIITVFSVFITIGVYAIQNLAF